MVYKDQFVAVITHNGKILRESRTSQEDVIQIPFGSEYAIRLKNLSSNRAVVSISIDDVDVLDGHRIVMAAGETHDLEGFMQNGTVRNKFKFIQKTQEIAEHRGDFIDDGIVKISYQFEKPTSPAAINVTGWPYPYQEPYWNNIYRDNFSGDRLIGCCLNDYHSDSGSNPRSILRGTCSGQSLNSSECFSKSVPTPMAREAYSEAPEPTQDEGITVKGSQTNIQYSRAYLNDLYAETNVITFKLVGVSRNNAKVVRPVTVRSKIKCPTCGHNNNSRYDFCTNCGTCLK